MGGVFFADNVNGWGVGKYGRIVSTKDGGKTWEIEESGVGCNLLGLDAIEEGNLIKVWVVGALGTVLSSDVVP